MNYFVIAADGNKYGPADLQTLNAWAQEGRVLSTSMLEDAATGQQIAATSLPGLVFPHGAPPMGQNFQNPNFQHAPNMQYAGDDGSGDITKVWIFSALSLCCPCICGIAAIVFASNAKKKGHPQAGTAMGVAIGAFILALIINGVARVAFMNSSGSIR